MGLDDETLEMLLLLLLADGEGQTAEELMAAVRRWLAGEAAEESAPCPPLPSTKHGGAAAVVSSAGLPRFLLLLRWSDYFQIGHPPIRGESEGNDCPIVVEEIGLRMVLCLPCQGSVGVASASALVAIPHM